MQEWLPGSRVYLLSRRKPQVGCGGRRAGRMRKGEGLFASPSSPGSRMAVVSKGQRVYLLSWREAA